MTDEDVVRRVADLFGRKYFKCRNRSPGRWKDCYSVKIRGAKAVTLMQQIRPYMSARRQAQIDRALACWPGEDGSTRSGKTRASLSSEDVRTIRQRLKTEAVTLSMLAQEYNVPLHVMKDISAGRTWAHLEA